jgi:uncharacterized protein YjbI with pentapeptide repeats
MKPERNDDVPVTFTDWLGITDAPRWWLARPLGPIVSVLLVLLFVLALAAAVVMLIRSFGAEDAGLGTGGLIVALLGAPFLIWATVIKQNTLAVSRQTLALSETALFNDKVNAALQGLYSRRQTTRVNTAGGEEKILTEWEDDIVQRNGAIDRLEGLANERPTEVPRIANMLSVYVRELSKELKSSELQTHPWQAYSELVDPMSGNKGLSESAALQQLGSTADDVSINKLRTWARGLKPFRTDVEKAAQTQGRLRDIAGVDKDNITIDLRGANLQGFDLKGLCFDYAKMDGARMEGANLSGARMNRANLNNALADGANLSRVQMGRANLSKARMEAVDLNDALMNGADLSAARMEKANLSKARMEGAKLEQARMRRVVLDNTIFNSATRWQDWFEGASVSGATAQFVDFANTPISAEQINSMFGDASVTLPNNITPTHPDWPAHWPKDKLDWWDFDTAYDTWLASQP